MNGKGDSNRTTNHGAYRENFALAFRPKEPFDSDAKKHEEAYVSKPSPSTNNQSQ